MPNKEFFLFFSKKNWFTRAKLTIQTTVRLLMCVNELFKGVFMFRDFRYGPSATTLKACEILKGEILAWLSMGNKTLSQLNPEDNKNTFA